MADKIPIKAIYDGTDVVALGEFVSGDTTPIANGGTGAVDITGSNTNLKTLTSFFDGLSASSFTYDGDGNVTQVLYTSGHKQTFTYTGSPLTKIEITYYKADGTTAITTCTVNFNVSGNTTSTSWS